MGAVQDKFSWNKGIQGHAPKANNFSPKIEMIWLFGFLFFPGEPWSVSAETSTREENSDVCYTHNHLESLLCCPQLFYTSVNRGPVCVYMQFISHTIKTIIIIIRIIALKGAIRDFYNLLTASRTVSNTYARVARCNRVQIMCNTSSTYHMQHDVCHMVWGTAHLLSLTELKLHLFQHCFIGWNHYPMKKDRKPEFLEKTPDDQLQKDSNVHVLKGWMLTTDTLPVCIYIPNDGMRLTERWWSSHIHKNLTLAVTQRIPAQEWRRRRRRRKKRRKGRKRTRRRRRRRKKM